MDVIRHGFIEIGDGVSAVGNPVLDVRLLRFVVHHGLVRLAPDRRIQQPDLWKTVAAFEFLMRVGFRDVIPEVPDAVSAAAGARFVAEYLVVEEDFVGFDFVDCDVEDAPGVFEVVGVVKAGEVTPELVAGVGDGLAVLVEAHPVHGFGDFFGEGVGEHGAADVDGNFHAAGMEPFCAFDGFVDFRALVLKPEALEEVKSLGEAYAEVVDGLEALWGVEADVAGFVGRACRAAAAEELYGFVAGPDDFFEEAADFGGVGEHGDVGFSERGVAAEVRHGGLLAVSRMHIE